MARTRLGQEEAFRNFQEKLHGVLPDLQKRYGVRSLGIFGSYVSGKIHPGSDLDVLVEFEVAPSLFRLIELEQYLSEIVGAKVDLVMRDSLKPALRQPILRDVIQV